MLGGGIKHLMLNKSHDLKQTTKQHSHPIHCICLLQTKQKIRHLVLDRPLEKNKLTPIYP